MSTGPIARQPQGTPAGGQFAAAGHSEPSIQLNVNQGPPSELFNRAAGTDRDPRMVHLAPLPERGGYVEVTVSDEDARNVLDRAGFDGDIVDGFDQVYASLSLISNRDADFWGVKAGQDDQIIAAGVHNYEEAVDPDDHETLNYRPGHANPMPEYNASQARAAAERLERSRSLLDESGISVDVEDLDRRRFNLTNREGRRLRMDTSGYPMRIQETANWRTPSEDDYDSFLEGAADEDSLKMFHFAATLTANDLADKTRRSNP